jgi:hypothetical protein
VLTENLSKVLAPLEDETLDEYLIRSMKNKELKQALLEEVKRELQTKHNEEITMKLNHMYNVLGNPNKRFGIHPDENGREALWEILLCRPANYEKPSFLKREEDC